MHDIEQKFHDEIEVERLWIATAQGKFVFFSIFPVSILLIFGLWDTASHTLLLIWFALVTTVNFLRWMILRYYYLHKDVLFAHSRQFKRVLLFGASLTGLCWGMGIIWLLLPSQPANVLIISVTLIIEVVGAMLTWFCYLPAVMAISIPATLPLVSLLFFQGGKIYLATSLILSLLAVFGIIFSIKLADMLNHALCLNFENAALRRESEEKSILLETALENMNQGISMSDQDDRLRMWNQQFTVLLGAAGVRISANSRLSDLLNAANPPLPVHTEGRTEYRLLDGQVYEIRQSELKQGGRVITYTDISDLIKREQTLEKARKEAEFANAAKTRFLAAASHDLRQPIHALGLFFAELSDRIYSPETAVVLGQIDDSISAISSMLNSLLDISKLDAGIVKPVVIPIELKGIFARLEAEFQPLAIENHNKLCVRQTTAIVNTDPAMLERILRNLIGNALRYTINGRVLMTSRPYGQHIQIQVLDTGTGISEDQLDDIFIEFYQLQNPARNRQQGLGLGLAIVKRLAHLLHHEIKVVSRLGHGSCFSVILPLGQIALNRKPDLHRLKTHSTNDSLTGRQILVLDDDIAVLQSMRGLLSRWGCQVITASSLAEAEEKLSTHQQKLESLIIDYRLPDNVSGIEVARNLQNHLGYSITVLVITGDTGPERLQEADASGYPLLHKPVQPAKLRSTLQYLISKIEHR